LEYYARVDYIYSSGERLFSVPFSYIEESHVYVLVDGIKTTNFEFMTQNQIKINDEINEGATVSIRRSTPLDNEMVKFTDGNILDEYTQNLAKTQTLNAVQEVRDEQDTLNANMQEFIDLKNSVNEQLNTKRKFIICGAFFFTL